MSSSILTPLLPFRKTTWANSSYPPFLDKSLHTAPAWLLAATKTLVAGHSKNPTTFSLFYPAGKGQNKIAAIVACLPHSPAAVNSFIH
jgi:hypothetical protein